MENYKRLVSYMYNYENGIKGNNVGYAKIEIRNSQCKITIHIRVLSLNERQLNTYIFHRENGLVNCISLGTVSAKNGVCECRIVTKTDNIMESGYSFEDMGGLVIYASNEKFFGTEWDDQPIDLKNVDVTINKIKEQSQLDHEESEDLEVAQISAAVVEQAAAILMEDSIPSVSKEDAALTIDSVMLEDILNSSTIEADIDKPEDNKDQLDHNPETDYQVKEESLSAVMDKVLEEEVPDIKVPDYHESAPEAEARRTWPRENRNTIPGKNRVDQIFMKYPKMYPFEDDEIIDCVRIEPQDIGIFPMEYWVYANNSFLLHSYYSYRHLVFAMKKQGNRVEYILGVPGIFHNREQFMARMFGFPNFKSIKNRELTAGEFGYWYFSMVL